MIDFSLAELTGWLEAHQQWILLSIGLISFLESLAIVGILVPGVAMLFAVAAAAGSTQMDLMPVLCAAFIGAVIGDGISFFLGRYYHQTIRKLPPFNTHPEWIHKGEVFFQRYGLVSVVIGRFVGPIRPVMPLIAGMLEMRPSRFLTINAISALGWAPLYILPGYLVGAAAETSNLNHQHLIFILTAVIGSWVFAQIIWWFKTLALTRSQKIKLTSSLFMLCCSGIVILFFLLDTQTVIYLNQATANLFLQLRHPDLDIFFLGLTSLGYFVPMVIWGSLVFLSLILFRQWYLAITWLVSTLSANALISGLKLFFAVPRPQLILSPLESFAYPSGHTCIIAVFFFLLFIFSSPALNFRWQKPLLSGAAIITALMALSRLYLGVHWLTDIIAGFLLAGVVCTAVLLLLIHKPFAAPDPRQLLLPSLLAVIINLCLWVVPNWEQLKQNHQPLYSGQF